MASKIAIVIPAFTWTTHTVLPYCKDLIKKGYTVWTFDLYRHTPQTDMNALFEEAMSNFRTVFWKILGESIKKGISTLKVIDQYCKMSKISN